MSDEREPFVMQKRTGWVIVSGWEARRVPGTKAHPTREDAERELQELQRGTFGFRWPTTPKHEEQS